MGTTFRPYSPGQELLLPPSLNEWLPEGHLAYFISDVAEELNLSAFYGRYEGNGRRNSPFDPRMMLKVLIYAYATGIFSSSRKIAREAELITLGTLAIDGTKIRANASKHKAMSYGRMGEEEDRLSKEIDALCRQARRTDESEDQQFGSDHRGDELPEEAQYRQARLDKIRAAKEKLEADQKERDKARRRSPDDDRCSPRGGRNLKRDYGVPDNKDQSNFTDPQSRIMKTADRFQQCYNGQLAVDGEFQLIIANRQYNNPSDNGCLVPLLDEVKNTLETYPGQCLADTGYCKEDDLQALEAKDIDGYVSLRREGKKTQEIDANRYPATARMAEKLATAAGRLVYAQHNHLVEAVKAGSSMFWASANSVCEASTPCRVSGI